MSLLYRAEGTTEGAEDTAVAFTLTAELPSPCGTEGAQAFFRSVLARSCDIRRLEMHRVIEHGADGEILRTEYVHSWPGPRCSGRGLR